MRGPTVKRVLTKKCWCKGTQNTRKGAPEKLTSAKRNSREHGAPAHLVVVAVVVVLTLTRINQVRGHRTGSSQSGVEEYLMQKIQRNAKMVHVV